MSRNSGWKYKAGAKKHLLQGMATRYLFYYYFEVSRLCSFPLTLGECDWFVWTLTAKSNFLLPCVFLTV